jgi:hypothetical protein
MRNTILFLLWIFTFSSCDRTSEMDNYYLYLDKILGEAPDASQQYVLVSDYSCSSCKGKVYREIEEKSSTKVYIILQPMNKVIIQDRFREAISENRMIIDTARLNLEKGVIIDKAVEVQFQDGKWVVRELYGVIE